MDKLFSRLASGGFLAIMGALFITVGSETNDSIISFIDISNGLLTMIFGFSLIRNA